MRGDVMRILRSAGLAGFVAASVLGVGAGSSSGTDTCGVAVDEADGEAGLRTALADAADAVTEGCTSWTVTLTGTFDLTEDLVWDTPVPLTLSGPADGMAVLRAVPLAPATSVTHRILTVDTLPTVVTVTLERLVLTGGDVSQQEDFGEDEGGAVYADVLHLVDVELIGNRARIGGAVSTVDLVATRTSFVGNEAELGDGLGGAVAAYRSVTLENVTFQGNVAKSGGAVHLERFDPDPAARFDATFVTFLDNEASDVGGGADLYLAADEVDLPIVLRGVLFGGVGADSQPSCGGDRFATPVTDLTWTDSLATDTSCGAPAGLVIDRPDYDTVPFRTGTTDLPVPTGEWEGLDAVDCDGTWPAVDQRGLERPQGEDDACDVGAVEREVEETPIEDPPVEDPPVDDTEDEETDRTGGGPVTGDSSDAPVAGPVPTSIPAGGGGCATGCP